MDTVGTGLLSIVGRLSLSRRSYLVWLGVSSLLLRVSTIGGSTVLLYMQEYASVATGYVYCLFTCV